MHHARDDAFAFLRKLIVLQGALVLAMSATIYACAPFVVRILYGSSFAPTVGVLRCLALVPFMACMTDLFGVQTMLPMGMKRAFSVILISSGVLNVTLLPPLAMLFAERGGHRGIDRRIGRRYRARVCSLSRPGRPDQSVRAFGLMRSARGRLGGDGSVMR